MYKLKNYLITSIILFIIFLCFTIYLYSTNTSLYKIENKVDFSDFNKKNFLSYINLIENEYLMKVNIEVDNDTKAINLYDENILFSRFFTQQDINEKFLVMHKDFVRNVKHDLNIFQNNLNNNTGINFKNAINPVSNNYYDDELLIVLNLYDLEKKNILKNLKKIITNANKKLFERIYKETINNIESTIFNLQYIELRYKIDNDNINVFLENLEEEDKSSIWKSVVNNHLLANHLELKQVLQAKKDAINAKDEVNLFFENLNPETFFVNYNESTNNISSKSKYNLYIYFILFFVLSLVLPIMFTVIYSQLRKIKL